MKEKTFAVLGLGSFGMSVADELMEHGAEVLVVDKNERLIEENAGRFTKALIADLTDEEEIRQLGLGNMDAVIVCMSHNLEASIMCVMVAKENGVHKVIAKAETKRNCEILKKIGADQIVSPEHESGVRMAIRLVFRDIIQFFDLTSDLDIVEIEPHKDWCGKTLRELNLESRFQIHVIACRKGEKVQMISGGETMIRSGEPLLIVTSKVKKSWNDDPAYQISHTVLRPAAFSLPELSRRTQTIPQITDHNVFSYDRFWMFPMSTIWGAYQSPDFPGFSLLSL